MTHPCPTHVGWRTCAISEKLLVAPSDHNTIIRADNRHRESLDEANINVDPLIKGITFNEAIIDIFLVSNFDNAIPLSWERVHSMLSGRKSNDTGMPESRLKVVLVRVLADFER